MDSEQASFPRVWPHKLVRWGKHCDDSNGAAYVPNTYKAKINGRFVSSTACSCGCWGNSKSTCTSETLLSLLCFRETLSLSAKMPKKDICVKNTCKYSTWSVRLLKY